MHWLKTKCTGCIHSEERSVEEEVLAMSIVGTDIIARRYSHRHMHIRRDHPTVITFCGLEEKEVQWKWINNNRKTHHFLKNWIWTKPSVIFIGIRLIFILLRYQARSPSFTSKYFLLKKRICFVGLLHYIEAVYILLHHVKAYV